MKHSFFQARVVSILLYGCTTWMLTKRLEKKLNGKKRDTVDQGIMALRALEQEPHHQMLSAYSKP